MISYIRLHGLLFRNGRGRDACVCMHACVRVCVCLHAHPDPSGSVWALPLKSTWVILSGVIVTLLSLLTLIVPDHLDLSEARPYSFRQPLEKQQRLKQFMMLLNIQC